MPMIKAGKSRFGGDDFGQIIATSHYLIKGNPRDYCQMIP